MAIKVGNRNASITVKGADQKIILDLIGEISAELVAVVDEEIEGVFVAARDGWPGNPRDPDPRLYDSSRADESRRMRERQYRRGPRWADQTHDPKAGAPTRDPRGSWANLERETRIDLDQSEVIGRVWNDVSYGRFIKSVRLGGKSVFVELIRKPMNKAAKRLERRLAQTIADGVENG